MKKARIPAVVFPMIFVFLLSASPDRYIQVFLPDETVITAELAVTDEKRQAGLMFREKINPDQGMLFLFEQEDIHSFWMKNVRFSLDILWLDKDRKIVHMEKSVPPCCSDDCPSYTNLVPAKYVLELMQGSVEAHGLKLLDQVDFILEPGFYH